ncbi:caspase family protein [Anabaena azotica]|uniref:Caspase family protein n=1 Tax=Anabaena azotica FACHB-119 TaxID=947527 RepID=A0ABR8DEU2_9NOST|nr:caspase family protein [Anabaena azotica]MBD2504905.1 caspase family protein [Anabaena azotica FACHB-119]
MQIELIETDRQEKTFVAIMTDSLCVVPFGIDEYVTCFRPLQGCVKDVTAIEEYLQGQVNTDEYKLHLCALLNKDAAQEAIIDGCCQHLSQARKEDVRFLYYAEHTSHKETAEEFWPIQPDRINETLVCDDSQSPDRWDLATQEMAKLNVEVAQENLHATIVIVKDNCPSNLDIRSCIEANTAEPNARIYRPKRLLDRLSLSYLEVEQLLTEGSLAKYLHSWN